MASIRETAHRLHAAGVMDEPTMRRFIPVEEAAREWMKQPEFVAAYDALEDEFAVASALIKARGDAATTQEQVAQPKGTTQAVVARLESGMLISDDAPTPD